MTPQRAKELLPIITAFAEGKACECKHKTEQDWKPVVNPSWLADVDYRIEPAPPRKVQLGPDDFPPPPGAIRLKDETKRVAAWEIVTVVRSGGIETDLRLLDFAELADRYEVFRPGLGWGPGFKMEETTN